MPVIRPEPTGRVEILDLTAVAYCCNVSPFTPQQWRQRNVLPPVDYPEVSTPLWKVATIREWARRTNRSFREPVASITERDAAAQSITERDAAAAQSFAEVGAAAQAFTSAGAAALAFSAPD